MYFGMDACNESELSTALVEQMVNTKEVGTWYALVDTAFDHRVRALPWTHAVWPLYHRDQWAQMVSVSPVILELGHGDAAMLGSQLRPLLRHCKGRPMLSFLQSDKSAQQLRDHWQPFLCVIAADEEQFVLRFADTRTCESLSKALAPEHWGRLTAPLNEWIIVNRNGQPQQLPLSDPNAVPASSLRESITLSAGEFERLLQFGQPDTLLNALHENFEEFLPQKARATTYQQMVKVCLLAQAHCIEAFPDQLALGAAVLVSNGQLLDDEKLLPWLTKRDWVDGQLDAALAKFMEVTP
jgi:Domain of unknown function (DUF4123)